MNCDSIAPFYDLFERVAFGGRLQRHRVAFLSAAAGKSRALIVGDGDGRFTQALASSYPDLEIDSLEMSTGMLAVARQRLTALTRVHLTQGDALEYPFLQTTYDIVFTHFFLDCFDNRQVSDLVTRLSGALKRDSLWIISEFRQAPRGWRKVFTQAWLNIMYFFFRHATGLETRCLPDSGL